MALFTASTPLSWDDCSQVLSEPLSTRTAPSGDDGRWGVRTLCLCVETLGILVNSAFLLVLFRFKPLHNVTNIYLANLAVADIMILVSAVVATILNHTSSYRPVEWVACVYQVAVTFPYYSAMSMISLVTWDIHFAICQPLEHRVVSSKARNVKLAAAAWTASALCSFLTNTDSILSGKGCRILQPPKKLVNSETSAEMCRPIHRKTRLVFHDDLAKVLPVFVLLIFNVVMYLRIVKALRRSFLTHRSKQQQVVPNPRLMQNIRRSRVRITRMLAINTVVFFSCNLMRIVLIVASYIQDVLGTEPRLNEDDQVGVYSLALMLFYPSINPLLYVLTNDSYRQGFWDVFMPCWRRPKPANKPEVFHLKIT